MMMVVVMMVIQQHAVAIWSRHRGVLKQSKPQHFQLINVYLPQNKSPTRCYK